MIRKYQAANFIAGATFGWSLGFPWCFLAQLAFAVVSTAVFVELRNRAERLTLPKAQVRS